MNTTPKPDRAQGRVARNPARPVVGASLTASQLAGQTTSQMTSHVQASSVPDGPPEKPEASPDLLSALSGLEANRERAVAHRTRRVVLGSLGVLNEQKHDRSRARAMAIAMAVVVLIVITPLIWEAVDIFIAGEHPGDPVGQLILWACLACPSLLAAVLVAGWWKRRS